ncbi:MAG: hypothetical protein KF765_11715 [Parvibaculaceae bacterium]|nr:hypothetical protein [Parvibaculaceae bacterium]
MTSHPENDPGSTAGEVAGTRPPERDPLAIDEAVIPQIDALTLERGRPLIVSDADEVLLQFMVGLERYLETQGLWIDLRSFALSGNIKRKGTNEPVPPAEMPALLDAFFAASAHDLEVVPGAAAALAELSERAQVVILTNVPLEAKARREACLAAQGIPFPVVANKGLKGGAVRRLAARVEAPVIFLDDIPHNLSSVAKAHAPTRLIHFIADPRLAKLLGPAKDSHFHTTLWPEAHGFIDETLKAEGF